MAGVRDTGNRKPETGNWKKRKSQFGSDSYRKLEGEMLKEISAKTSKQLHPADFANARREQDKRENYCQFTKRQINRFGDVYLFIRLFVYDS